MLVTTAKIIYISFDSEFMAGGRSLTCVRKAEGRYWILMDLSGF